MVCYFTGNVHSCSIKDQYNTILLSNCQLILTTDVKATNSAFQLLFSDNFALDSIPFNEKLVFSSSEELIAIGRDTKSPKLFIEVAVHQNGSIGKLCYLYNLSTSSSNQDVPVLLAD